MQLGKLQHVDVKEIRDDDYQMRNVGDDENFNELVDSVRFLGVLMPILLKKRADNFHVVAGHRRFKAAQIANLSEVPAYVFAEESSIGWNAAFAENLYRKDLSPIEEAAAIQDCLAGGVMNVKSLSAALCRSEAWINDRISFLEWPDDLTLAVHVGKISVSAARNLTLIDDDTHRSMLISYAVDNGATARTTAAWLQAWRAGTEVSDPGDLPLEEGRNALPPIKPYTPCIICGVKQEMAHLTYAPVCAGCSEIVMSVAREVRSRDAVGT